MLKKAILFLIYWNKMYSNTYNKQINILFDIAEEQGISKSSLLSNDRDKHLVKTRRIIMLILSDYIEGQIGEKANPKDVAAIVPVELKAVAPAPTTVPPANIKPVDNGLSLICFLAPDSNP